MFGPKTYDTLSLTGTVGSQLSELRLSEHSIIRMLGRCHVFSSSGKNMFRSLHGVLLQEKAMLVYERLFPDATAPSSVSAGF